MKQRACQGLAFTGVTLLAAAAHASPGAGLADPAVVLGAMGAVLLPSDVGTDVQWREGASARLAIGWSYQVPFDVGPCSSWSSRHRMIFGADLLLGGDATGRGRVGYRYANRWLIGGAGFGVDRDGATLSPELGVKFAHVDGRFEGTSLHVLARTDIAVDSGALRGVTMMLGWNLL